LEDYSKLAADSITSDFERSVSRPRFRRYLRDYPDSLDAIAVYLWNVSLCSALYPSLQCAEITYRNALNDALRAQTGTQNWFDDPHLLLPNERRKVQNAKTELTNQGRSTDSGRVVAELTFGFWVSLYSSPYIATVVHPTLKTVFPNTPKHLRSQRHIVDRLQEIRKLRNRISHHEPIWHWVKPVPGSPQRVALITQYEDMLALTDWIGSGQAKAIRQIDCFRQVHDDGWEPFREQVDLLLLDEEIALEAARTAS
jgi:hypothetical protein